jgi:hypothetical protein
VPITITTDVIMTDVITTATKIGEVRRCRIFLHRQLLINTQDTAPAALQRAFLGTNAASNEHFNRWPCRQPRRRRGQAV